MSNLQTLHTERLHRSALRCIWSPGPNTSASRPIAETTTRAVPLSERVSADPPFYEDDGQ